VQQLRNIGPIRSRMQTHANRAPLLFYSLVGCLALAALLPHALIAAAPAEGARPTPMETSLDVTVFRFLNATIENRVFDAVMPFVTDFHRWRIYAVAAWFALIFAGGTRGRWAAIMLIPLVAASDQLTSTVIKPLVMRLRPTEVIGHVHFWSGGSHWIWTPSDVVGGFKSSFGFPSSHASNLTASMLFLSLIYRRWAPYLCLPFAGAVCLSRIYIGAHWPSDVLVGIVIGAALACIAYIAFKRILLWRQARTP
jgi:undecaprenyl-diphosphatase